MNSLNKNNQKKVLILVNQLLFTCGISKHLLYFLEEVKNYPENEFTIICGGGDAVDVYKPLVNEVLVWQSIRHENRSFFNFIKTFFRLLILQKEKKFDIIHSHHHYSANLAAFVSKLTRIKVIHSNHGILEPIGKLNHFPVKNIIAVNEHVYDYLKKELNYKDRNIYLIRNGISFHSNLEKPENYKLKVISSGRLVEEKAFDVFIKAVSLLSEEVKNKAEFYIAGKGASESQLLELNQKLGAGIIFLGEVIDFVDYLKQTDIFVNPSRSKSEGFPLVISEAALTKNLIISSKFYGHYTLLKDQDNCLLFDVDDINELKKILEETLTNFEDKKPIIFKMYDEAKKNFDNTVMTKKIIELYNNMLK